MSTTLPLVLATAWTPTRPTWKSTSTKVKLIAPFEPNDDNVGRLSSDGSGPTTITFRRSAGITLPTVHGDYDIKVSTEETQEGTAEEEEGVGGDGVKNTVKVRRQVKVSPTSGKRGTEVTITAKGYSDNTHDIVMGSGDNSLTQTADATDGVFTLTVDTSVKNNDGNPVFQGPHDTPTTITVDDAKATFTIKASFSWEPESPTPGQDITVTLSDIEPTTDEDGADVAPSKSPLVAKAGAQKLGTLGDEKRHDLEGSGQWGHPAGQPQDSGQRRRYGPSLPEHHRRDQRPHGEPDHGCPAPDHIHRW